MTCQGVVLRVNASRVPPSRPQGFQICSPVAKWQRGRFGDDVAVDEPFGWVENERDVGFNFDVFLMFFFVKEGFNLELVLCVIYIHNYYGWWMWIHIWFGQIIATSNEVIPEGGLGREPSKKASFQGKPRRWSIIVFIRYWCACMYPFG